MKTLLNISMFLFSPLLISMIHVKRVNRMGGGVQQSQEIVDFFAVYTFH